MKIKILDSINNNKIYHKIEIHWDKEIAKNKLKKSTISKIIKALIINED